MENSHVSALQMKHEGLEAKIRAEMARPMPNTVEIASLKKQKLRLKEALISA